MLLFERLISTVERRELELFVGNGREHVEGGVAAPAVLRGHASSHAVVGRARGGVCPIREGDRDVVTRTALLLHACCGSLGLVAAKAMRRKRLDALDLSTGLLGGSATWWRLVAERSPGVRRRNE